MAVILSRMSVLFMGLVVIVLFCKASSFASKLWIHKIIVLFFQLKQESYCFEKVEAGFPVIFFTGEC